MFRGRGHNNIVIFIEMSARRIPGDADANTDAGADVNVNVDVVAISWRH